MAIKYIPYFPEPIEGQAILDNFSRTLKYKGCLEVKDKLKRGMPLYEVETIENVGEESDNMVIRGECLSACAYLKDNGIKVDLVYIDPPFASGADYAKKVYIRKNPKVAEAIFQAEQELDIEDLKTFEEKMYGDVWNKEDYLNWMYENLMAIKSIMSETASIYVHLDWHIGHYVKILMDEIFGEDNFVNEIIWSYRSGGASKKSSLPKKHDVIFLYKKSDIHTLNFITERQYLEKPFMGSPQDEQGRYYVDTILRDVIEGLIISVNKNGALEEFNARPVLNLSSEQKNYATQKPEGLLGLLINIASNEGMIVADFFGGSGVTATVANKLNRKFIHCDIGINSIQTTRDGLITDKANFSMKEIKDGVSLYRNPAQTMDKIESIVPGLKKEDSLDKKYWIGAIQDSKEGMIPIYTPNLKDSTTKLLDIPMMNEIIHKAIPDLPDGVKKVIVYYIDINDIDEIEKFIEEDDSTDIQIELRDLKELLDDVIVEDVVEFDVKEIQEKLFKEYKVTINNFTSDRVIQKIEEYNEKKYAQSLKGTNKKYTPITISEEGLETIEYVSLDCTNKDGIWHSDSEIKIDGKTSYVIINGEKKKEFWDGTIKSEKKPLRLKVRNICGDETIILIKEGE